MWSLTFLLISFIFQQSYMSPFANFGRLDDTSPLSRRILKEKFLITNGEHRKLESKGDLTCRRGSPGDLTCEQGSKQLICRPAGLSPKGDTRYVCERTDVCRGDPCLIWWVDHIDGHMRGSISRLAGAPNQGNSARRIQAKGRRGICKGRRRTRWGYCNGLKHYFCRDWVIDIVDNGNSDDCDDFLTCCCF